MSLLTIENKSGKVKLTDAVTPWSVEKLTEEIGKLFGASASDAGADFGAIINAGGKGVDTLEIEINSPGGSIFDGYNIYNEILSLRERGVVVTATVTGMCASMASVIAMACDEIRMVPHARMMIHEASQAVRGNSDELRKAANLLDSISVDIAFIYSNRTGKSMESIRKMMKEETWMTATEAVASGFANALFDIRATPAKPAGMSILSALFPGNDQVAKLEAQVLENDQLRADLAEANAKIAEVQGLAVIVTEKDAELVAITATNAASLESLAVATTELETLKAELETVKASTASGVIEALASIGQEAPISEIVNTSTNYLSRAEFNAKTPKERLVFVKAGGKIS